MPVLAVLLFFAAYQICKKNYSFCIMRSYLFFYQFICANYFYFQINGLGSAVRTNISEAVGPGSNLCRAIDFNDFTDIFGSHGTVGEFWSARYGFASQSCQMFLWFHWHFSEFPVIPTAQWVGQQGSETVVTGSNPSLYLQFLTLIRWKISWYLPSYAWKF